MVRGKVVLHPCTPAFMDRFITFGFGRHVRLRVRWSAKLPSYIEVPAMFQRQQRCCNIEDAMYGLAVSPVWFCRRYRCRPHRDGWWIADDTAAYIAVRRTSSYGGGNRSGLRRGNEDGGHTGPRQQGPRRVARRCGAGYRVSASRSTYNLDVGAAAEAERNNGGHHLRLDRPGTDRRRHGDLLPAAYPQLC